MTLIPAIKKDPILTKIIFPKILETKNKVTIINLMKKTIKSEWHAGIIKTEIQNLD